MGIGDFIVIAIVLLLVIFAIALIVKNKKNGKHISCGGDCASCMGQCDFAKRNDK